MSTVPYGEPNSFQKGYFSAYYTKSHIDFKLAVRKFMAEHIKPYADDWEENGTQPSKEIYLLLGKEGMLAA